MSPNVKKYVVIGLIVLVGGALLIGPLMQGGGSNTVISGGGGSNTLVNNNPPPAAQFAFEENLAVVSGGTQTVEIKLNKSDLASVAVEYEGVVLQKWDNPTANVSFPFTATTLGTFPIRLTATLSDGTETVDGRLVQVVSDITPVRMEAQIIGGPLPHSTTSFTQGLEFKDGKLFEGVGVYGQSRVMEVNLQSGDALRTMALDGSHFGEGITILNDKLYQLTWQNGKCLIYDYTTNAESFTLLDEKAYSGEGWGLCNNGTELIMSDGSEVIKFIDPESFQVLRTINVYSDTGRLPQLNELEFIDGKIYANVYQTEAVAVIDPATGKVLQIIDCSALAKGRGTTGQELNGIAKDNQTGDIYLTGKNWISMFKVRFVAKPVV